MVCDLETGQPLLEYKPGTSDRRNVSVASLARIPTSTACPMPLSHHSPARLPAHPGQACVLSGVQPVSAPRVTDRIAAAQFAGEAQTKATGWGKQQQLITEQARTGMMFAETDDTLAYAPAPAPPCSLGARAVGRRRCPVAVY
jgi:hypothetical protein